MQIVIDMPKKEYDVIVNQGYIGVKDCHVSLSSVIKNGTPLPKGHGRIADMDAAIRCIKDCEGEDAIWAISLIEWACSKRTLIEADKVESEVEDANR